jgi:hypothetical protein
VSVARILGVAVAGAAAAVEDVHGGRALAGEQRVVAGQAAQDVDDTVGVGGAQGVGPGASSGVLDAVVPASATTGRITVTNTAAPVGTVTSATNFTKT